MINKLKSILSREGDLKEIITKSSSAMVFRVIGMVTNYLFLTFVIFKFGSESWGVFAICFTILQVCSMIGTLGMEVAMVKLFAMEKIDKRKIFKNAISYIIPVNLLVMGLTYWQADLIASLFKDAEGMNTYIRYMSLGILPFSLTLVIAGAFRGLKNIIVYTVLDSLGRFFMGLLFVFILSFFFLTNETIIIGFVSGLYALLLISSIVFYRKLKTIEKPFESQSYSRRELLSFSLNLLWNPLANRGISWAMIFILGYSVSKSDIGIYDACFRLGSGVLAIISFSINSISAPKFAEFNNHRSLEKLNSIVQYAAKLLFFSTIPAFVVLLTAGWWILNFFGTEFSAHFLVFVFIIVGQLIGILSGPVGFFMQMTGHHVAFRNILLLSLALNIIMGIFLIPIYGIEGAGLVIGITFALKNLLGVIYVYRKTKIRTFYFPVLKRAK